MNFSKFVGIAIWGAGVIAAPFLFSNAAAAAGKVFDYPAGAATMEGYLATPDKAVKPARGILLTPDWMGVGPYFQKKADQLAKEGYTTLVVDVYGKGERPKDQKDAAKFAGKYKDDRALFRDRMKAAYDALAKAGQVDPKRILVMGYCFGGTGALELARSGAELAGVATFHGGLDNPDPSSAKAIRAPVLVMHGGADPYVPPAQVEAFKKEMNEAGKPFEFIVYPGAVHAFAVPTVGTDVSTGVAYNAEADRKSWADFQKFLKKVFK